VTPLALPLREHVERSDSKLLTTVKAILEISSTLSDIHSRNAAHRDIKPENLFIYRDRAVIGDFGLVTYPGKEPVTESGERLGPIHYVAPELIGNVEEPADCGPGDVYALAKTLWVLASGQRYPLPGNLSATERASQLSAFVKHDRAVLLDRLLDSATVLDSQRRPTCPEFAAELSAWLSEKRVFPATLPISDSVWARLHQLTEVANSSKQERDLAREESGKITAELHARLKSMGEQIAANAGIACRSRNLPDGNTNIALQYFPCFNEKQEKTGADNRCFAEHFLTVRGDVIVMAGCAVLEFLSPTVGLLKGGLVLAANHRQTEYILQREFRFPFGSAKQEAGVSEFLSDLQGGLPDLVSRLVEILQEEETRNPNPNA
jgi:serine/threonine protein kinase